jgi:hypothetical protein
MKYLKRMNELFDDEKIRSKFSDDYLSGDFSPEDTLTWNNYSFDKILDKLLESVNYLNSLKFNKTGSILEFTFEEKREGLDLLFNIEVSVFQSGTFNLNVISSSFINDKKDWSESELKSFKDLSSLINFLNGKVFSMIKDFSDYCEQYDIKVINNSIKYDLN